MGFWDRLFGRKEEPNRQLPSSMVAKEFGEVNVRRKGDTVEVLFTILMEPTGDAAEGWQTGVALDASQSMLGVYGKGLDPGHKGDPPQRLFEDYHRKGWLQLIEHQGQTFPILSPQAKMDLVQKGYFRWSKNTIEPVARDVTAYLAANLDADGGTTVVYWACGDGREVEVIGDLTSEQCATAEFAGPTGVDFGQGTFLAPAVRYFADRFKDARNGMYIFLTDGELNDLDDVKRLTVGYCREIAAKKRNPLKCVLIGLGDNINESQMEELDDLESGTEVDIWDHKIA
jgi:hypothetical protein